MAPKFYLAFLVPNQRAASKLNTPVTYYTGFFVQLIAKIDYTGSTDVFKCGVRDKKICIVTVMNIKLYYAKMTLHICKN